MIKFDIPPSLQHLKIDKRGYPVPFFVPIIDGVPNFTYMDNTKVDLCIDRHLCGICGRKLYDDYCYFISGPLGYKNQVSSDAAMHRECAEFSLKVCPHMYYHKLERKGVDMLNPIVDVHIKEKPEFIFLIKASKFKATFYPELKQRLIHYKSVSAEKYIYVDNKLQKEIHEKNP